ncbi:MAG TPA: disulfide bond formation protein B [Acidimicrobiia bacterium]|nr:disulfide bond formation protein B [Acidimicrobiia bacterium]
MSVHAVTTFLSLLALVALAGAVVTVVAATGARANGALGLTLRRSALGLAATVAVVSLAGSLYLSEVAHFLPCRLCWYQRIAMYPLAVVLVVAALRRDAAVRWYAIPLAVGGLAISLWHLGVEHLGIGEGACDIANPCSIRWVEHFGFVTIPFMAACGFVAIAVLTAVADPFADDDADVDGDGDDAATRPAPSRDRGARVMEGSGT